MDKRLGKDTVIRLFISLYLVVIIGLFTINWGSEFIWRQFAQHNTQELSQLSNIARALPYLLKQENNSDIQFTEITGIPLTYRETDDIAWLTHQKQKLSEGEPVIIYDNNDHPSLYIKSKSKDQLIQLGPLPRQQADLMIKYFILFVSYLFLALFISLWIQPVWRDLRYLKLTAAQIEQHNFKLSEHKRSHSPIAGIVNAIDSMAATITSLLSEQKQLINAVSHELRTPLSRLRFSLALDEHINSEQKAEISQDIGEIESLIDEMLSYSRIEHIGQTLQYSQVDISELLRNQVEKLQRGTQITLTIDVAEDLIFSCQGDLIERACQNLIVNGISHALSQVRVTAVHQSQTLVICISDDGKGIDAANREHIFSPFCRLDKSRNKNKGGVGLGLAIVKKAMDWHQGQCDVGTSSLGGAKFIITIPHKDLSH